MKIIIHSDQILLAALAKLSPGSSKTTLRSWLKEERVTVDGQVVKIGTAIVHKGQVVALGAKLRYLPEGMRIHYEDQHLVVVEKPSGLLSVAAAYEKVETAHKILKDYYHPRKVYVVHRLDQDTSGLMLFALSEQAYEGLKIDFEKHVIERIYMAVVDGILDSSEGTWESYLYEDPNYVVHSVSDPSRGELAITHYSVEKAVKKRSLLRLRLETGKKNQIRVHCKEAGHPVVGDKKYGSHSNPIKRLCLHSHYLAFTHPVTKRMMCFESPVPETFYGLI